MIKNEKTLNYVADYVLKVTGFDVRENTSSRKQSLVHARYFYIYLSVEVAKQDAEETLKFIKKDRTSYYNSKKQWSNFVNSDYTYEVEMFKLKYNGKHDKIKELETLNDKYKEAVKELEAIKKDFAIKENNYLNKIKTVSKSDNKLLNGTLKELLTLDKETFNFVCETRIKPFLRMHKTRITNEDLIKKQVETRRM